MNPADKTKCRHLWCVSSSDIPITCSLLDSSCREGLEKPPVVRSKTKNSKSQSASTSLDASSKPPVAQAKLFNTLDPPTSSKHDPPRVRLVPLKTNKKNVPGPKLGTSLFGNKSTSLDSSSSDDLPLISALSTSTKFRSGPISHSSVNKSSISAPTLIEIDDEDDEEVDQLESPTPSPPPQKKASTKRAPSSSIFAQLPKRPKGPPDVSRSSPDPSSASAKPKERLFLLSPSRSPAPELRKPVEMEVEVLDIAAEVEDEPMEVVGEKEEGRTDEDADFEEWMQENVMLVA